MKRYDYSVLQVCQMLHGHYCGTGEALMTDELDLLKRWLAWRVSDGWLDGFKTHDYDDAVRAIAVVTLREAA